MRTNMKIAPYRYIVRPEKNEDSGDDDNEPIWAMQESKKNDALGSQLPFAYSGPEEGVFEVRPTGPENAEEDQ
jgi:hypothetical protein